MDELVKTAARNNAHWCQSMCRAHGITGTFDADAWTSPRRTPLYYPDAVTLTPLADAGEILGRIDATPGCSIKDSFAALDLTANGFTTLFDAQWIHHEAPGRLSDPSGDETWQVITKASDLERWQREWSDDEDPVELFVPGLLDDPDVAVIAGRRGDRFIGGAVLNRSDTEVGVSNLFDLRADTAATWAAVLSIIAQRYPGLPVFGYESGGDLDVALRSGFSAIGGLRIWWRRA